jgi:ASCH domain
MLALSIRQPYAELILQGIKTAELRKGPTRIIGQRFYLYAAKAKAEPMIWSDDLQSGQPPGWMVELARQVKLIPPGLVLPTGVIVGTATIGRVVDPDPADGARGKYRWELADVQRLAEPIKPQGHPQPTWWRPKVD